MKRISLLALIFLSNSCFAWEGGPWLEQTPASLGTWQHWTKLPKSYFFEVSASKLATAEAWLEQKPYFLLKESNISYFGGQTFSCATPNSAYLIRAAYINGGTGGFELFLAKSSLVVSHASLGHKNQPSKTALVVCLPKAPDSVFSSLSTAL